MKRYTMGLLIFAMLIATANAATLPLAGEWTGWTTVGNPQSSGNPYFSYMAPAVVHRGPGTLDLFSFDTANRGTTGSQLKWIRYENGWDAGGFISAVAPLPNGTNPVGVAVTDDHSRIDVWAQGGNYEPYGHDHLHQTVWTSEDGWDTGWELPAGHHIDVTLDSGPAVLWHGSNEYVFWVNSSMDYLLVLKWTGTGPWNGWEEPVDLGVPGSSYVYGSPSACYDSHTGDIFVFVREAATKKLWYYQYDGSTGGGGDWHPAPGGSNLTWSPSAVSRCPGIIDVFYRAQTEDVYEKLLVYRQFDTTSNSWSDEIVLFDFLGFSDPAAVSWDENRLDVFIQYTDGSIDQNTWINRKRVGVFRRSTRQFILCTDPITRITYGLSNDTPVTGDWNGDGKTEIGVFRAVGSAGQFILDLNNDGSADTRVNFGISTDRPVTGDWDNDGYDEIGVFRSGQFILDNTNYNTAGTKIGLVSARINFGVSTDTPITGDWDKDGYGEIGVYRSVGSQGQFILDNTNYNTAGTWTGTVSSRTLFGVSTDTPIPVDYNNDGKTEIGVYRSVGSQGQFIVKTFPVSRYNFGVSTDTPITGIWV